MTCFSDMEEQIIFFDSWMSLLRTFLIGIFAYVAMIVLLRVSGKRTLSKMNAFDFIVTVALGSTLASVIVTKNIALADGVLAFSILIFLQFIITKAAWKSKKVVNLVKSNPTLLFYRNRFLQENMKKERVTKEEILASVRQNGFKGLQNVEAVIIETDGSLSIISKSGNEDTSALDKIT
ncbi:DUF421 domain-containing protein [Cytophagaceae bacterium ABcell3]|nr:DUF421 domain-containing protein [Cytophagaceae bacterium ABcell3]